MAKPKRELVTIGKLEEVSFPDLGLQKIHAKIDTGAYTSSLHCYQIKETERGLRVKFLDRNHDQYTKTGTLFTEYSQARVRSTSGHMEERYKVRMRMKMGRKIFRTEFTLTDRSYMRYPILLGRKALQRRFLVDVSRKYVLSKNNK